VPVVDGFVVVVVNDFLILVVVDLCGIVALFSSAIREGDIRRVPSHIQL
jgi:hypothetical protein